MPKVMCEGGYREVAEAYVVRLPADEYHREAGLSDDIWTVFDANGLKCVCSTNRSTVFHWATNNDIKIVARH